MQSNMDSASKGNGNDEEMDRKRSANQQEMPLSLPLKHGFTFAMENVKLEELPGYVGQYFNALTFPEKVSVRMTNWFLSMNGYLVMALSSRRIFLTYKPTLV